MSNQIFIKKSILLISTLQSFTQSYVRVNKDRVESGYSEVGSLEINLQQNCLDVWNEINKAIKDEDNVDGRHNDEISIAIESLRINVKELFEDIKHLYGSNAVNALCFSIHNLEMSEKDLHNL